VVIGEEEKVAAPLFEEAIRREKLASVVYGETALVEDILVIRGATVNRIIEIVRG